jgi:hypothetical protein
MTSNPISSLRITNLSFLKSLRNSQEFKSWFSKIIVVAYFDYNVRKTDFTTYRNSITTWIQINLGYFYLFSWDYCGLILLWTNILLIYFYSLIILNRRQEAMRTKDNPLQTIGHRSTKVPEWQILGQKMETTRAVGKSIGMDHFHTT